MSNLRWIFSNSRSWPATDATVTSCDWIKSHDHAGEIAGHYQVHFTYRVKESQQECRGEFCHHGIRHIVPYSVGERLVVQYDPAKPSRHHYSGAAANYEKLEAIAVVTAFALLAGYFLYAF